VCQKRVLIHGRDSIDPSIDPIDQRRALAPLQSTTESFVCMGVCHSLGALRLGLPAIAIRFKNGIRLIILRDEQRHGPLQLRQHNTHTRQAKAKRKSTKGKRLIRDVCSFLFVLCLAAPAGVRRRGVVVVGSRDEGVGTATTTISRSLPRISAPTSRTHQPHYTHQSNPPSFLPSFLPSVLPSYVSSVRQPYIGCCHGPDSSLSRPSVLPSVLPSFGQSGSHGDQWLPRPSSLRSLALSSSSSLSFFIHKPYHNMTRDTDAVSARCVQSTSSTNSPPPPKP
jgi:hypothetical protein